MQSKCGGISRLAVSVVTLIIRVFHFTNFFDYGVFLLLLIFQNLHNVLMWSVLCLGLCWPGGGKKG